MQYKTSSESHVLVIEKITKHFEHKKLRISYLLILTYVLGSFEYQQHMFWLRNKKIIFP